MRIFLCLGGVALAAGFACAQSSEQPPRFAIADVRASGKDPHHDYGGEAPVNGRYEIHSATMVELIQAAWGVDPDKIIGGPSWLELDRYDVVARLPASASTPAVPAVDGPAELPLYLKMLQTLLAERFRLVVRKELRPFPSYVMTLGKKPLLKAADGSGDTGCRVVNNGPVNSGDTLQVACRNMTSERIAGIVGSILGTELGSIPVVDKTGLKGTWNIEFGWKVPERACPKCDQSVEDRANFLESVDKQIGLKLEQQQVPTPVIVVESADRKPSANPPGVAEALPPVVVPHEFELAVIKPTAPDFNGSRWNLQPGGRVVVQGMTLDSLLIMALGTSYNVTYKGWVVGIPDWAQSERFDITAKAPGSPSLSLRDNTLQPILRSLLEERFGLKTHREERELPAYTLVAVKPRMKKGDPASRSHCLNAPAPQGAPVGTVVLNCQNIAMDEFADRYVRNFGTAFGTIFAWPPVVDATGLEGGWDFTLTYFQAPVGPGGEGRGGGNGQASNDTPSASDPGGGLSVTEAVEKQLGLKLELRKRSMPVTVIDHLERKPTDN